MLADEFEKSRNCALYPNYGLSWDAILSMTKNELELVSDGERC